MSAKITNQNNKLGIEEGDDVLMPEPSLSDDAWTFSSFIARVDRIRNKDGVEMATVIDADDEAFDIELDRLELP